MLSSSTSLVWESLCFACNEIFQIHLAVCLICSSLYGLGAFSYSDDSTYGTQMLAKYEGFGQDDN